MGASGWPMVPRSPYALLACDLPRHSEAPRANQPLVHSAHARGFGAVGPHTADTALSGRGSPSWKVTGVGVFSFRPHLGGCYTCCVPPWDPCPPK